jgi:hypothetical protein
MQCHQESIMSEQQTVSQFRSELERRFDELQQWAIAHWPDEQQPLSTADFTAARKCILGIGPANLTTEENSQAPEPADGGPQYVSTTPAPWP